MTAAFQLIVLVIVIGVVTLGRMQGRSALRKGPAAQPAWLDTGIRGRKALLYLFALPVVAHDPDRRENGERVSFHQRDTGVESGASGLESLTFGPGGTHESLDFSLPLGWLTSFALGVRDSRRSTAAGRVGAEPEILAGDLRIGVDSAANHAAFVPQGFCHRWFIECRSTRR